jgi:gamma-glutamyltranspeptidase/glutathione hydrolase
MRKRTIQITILILISFLFGVQTVSSEGGRRPVLAKNGMVVSTQVLASKVGRDVLMDGGNAVDAAIATAFALAVTHPSAGNIGGGGFMVYHGADGTVTVFNFREKAPLAATETMFLDENGQIKNNSNHKGILAIGVPGTVAGLYLAHQRLGSKAWPELVEPAIKLAKEGFPVSWALSRGMRRVANRAKDRYPATLNSFLKNGKEQYGPGDIWRQPDLAATLNRIRKNGRNGFYNGKTARLIAEFMKKNGGLITEEDLARYEAREQKPIHGTYRGHDVYSMSPPSSGGVALVEMLNILEGFNLAKIGHNSAHYLHLLTEAMRRAYADRALYLGDPDFNPDMPIARLTSKEYAAKLRADIEPYRASKSRAEVFNQISESTETTHFSVVDSEGNTVAVTYTLEYGYGSGIVVEGAGFLLNNEMGDFNAVPGRTDTTGYIGTPPNLIAPEKHMLSSMTPTILAKDGKPVLVVGSPGGKTIINTVLQVVLNFIDHKMNVAEAIESGRIHHQWLPDSTSFERLEFSPDSQRLYEMYGHRIRYRSTQGRAMGIAIDWENGILYGAADSRSYDGRAVGY